MLMAQINLSGVEWRTIDGSNNNAANPTQGAARTQQIRFGYGDRFPDDNGDVIITSPQRANPRTISNAIHGQSGSVPSQRLLTDWAFQWGQWVTHDMDLTVNGPQNNILSDGTLGDFSIAILDPTDPLGPNPIPFNRSEYAAGTGVNNVRRDVVNSITSYIDASNVYGSDPARTSALRTFQGGKLKTSAGGLLPLNTAGLPNADQFGAGSQLFLAGDIRANEQIGLTTVHTLFVREHNRLATKIGQLYSHLNDEQIFQLARRLVGAEQQIITYQEYLPAVFGFDFAPNPDDAPYDANVDASITNSFAHAAFRFGHSEINETTLLVNNFNQVVGNLSIRDAFFNPDILKNDPGNVGRILKGLASQVGQEVDLQLVDGIRNSLFGPPGAGGLDLAALDIQRGRDHGLPDYNNLRGNYGLTPVDSFDDISSDPAIQQKLEELYVTVDNIDAFVGALAEDHVPGTSAGPLLHGIVGNQFLRLRDGDRFFYTNDALLDSAKVKAVLDIDKVSLAQIIRLNTGVQNLQDEVFYDRSVLVYRAPDAGANVSLVTNNNSVSLIDTARDRVLVSRSLAEVAQVLLVGSDSSADVFNVFIAGANGRIENGVSVYGGGSAGDRLNVYGRAQQFDAFAVSGSILSANTTTAADADIVLQRSAEAREVDINGNDIFGTGFETLRLVTRGGGDTVTDADLLALVVLFWDPESDD
jgi:hypothetical protein